MADLLSLSVYKGKLRVSSRQATAGSATLVTRQVHSLQQIAIWWGILLWMNVTSTG